MQFSIDRDALYQELSIARKYLSKLVPALGNFLFEADDKMQRVTVTASDAQNIFVTHVPAQVKKPGSWILSSAMLFGSVRNIDTGKTLDIKENNGSALMTCDKAKITIPTMNASSFIAIPYFAEDATLDILSEELKYLFMATSIARMTKVAAAQDFKFEGVSLKIKNGLAMLSCTDKNRIAIGRYQFNQQVDSEFILSSKAVEDFLSGIPKGEMVNLKINTQAGRIMLQAGDRIIFPALHNDKYPDVTRFVPVPLATITVNRENLISKLEIANLVSTQVDMKAKGKTLHMESNGIGTGAFVDALPATVTTSMDITLHVSYFLEGLKVIDTDEVELLLTADDKPAIIRPKGKSDYAYLLMPVA